MRLVQRIGIYRIRQELIRLFTYLTKVKLIVFRRFFQIVITFFLRIGDKHHPFVALNERLDLCFA
jgi:hypothetical protein